VLDSGGGVVLGSGGGVVLGSGGGGEPPESSRMVTILNTQTHTR